MPVMHSPHTRTESVSDEGNEPILFDGCDRCAQHAEMLYDLDGSHIRTLWQRMIAVETDTTNDICYRSVNEAKACQKLFLFYLLVERFGVIHPKLLFPIK